MMTYWSYNADSRKLVIYGRDPHNTPEFETTSLDFEQALALSEAIAKIYEQGLEHGRNDVARKVQSVLQQEAKP